MANVVEQVEQEPMQPDGFENFVQRFFYEVPVSWLPGMVVRVIEACVIRRAFATSVDLSLFAKSAIDRAWAKKQKAPASTVD